MAPTLQVGWLPTLKPTVWAVAVRVGVGQCTGFPHARISSCVPASSMVISSCVPASRMVSSSALPPPHPPSLPLAVLAAADGEEQPAWVVSRAGQGDYYRPLAPGRYTVVVSKPGYKPFAANFTVPADGSGAQRHFVLAKEGSSWGGEMAHAPRFLGGAAPEGAAAADSGGGSFLPWKARLGLNGSSEAGQPWSVEETRSRDRLYLLAAGAACMYGLWVTHSRLKRRSHPRRA